MVDALDIVGMTTVGGDKSIGSVVLIDDTPYKIKPSEHCFECAFTNADILKVAHICDWLCSGVVDGDIVNLILVRVDNGCN